MYSNDSREGENNDFRKSTIAKIEDNSKFYLGIQRNSFSIVNHLATKIQCPYVNIMIALQKIKLNDSFERLGIDFNLHKSYISRIFKNTLPFLANYFKELIVFPSKDEAKASLPLSFKKGYSNVLSIVDCFEIRIELPENMGQQDSSWSMTKNCNTLKYLVSISPDGLVNYVTNGYAGSTSNTDIFLHCNLLKLVAKGGAIMASKEFKAISSEVEKSGCHLVRMPNVVSKSNRHETETKRISAIRSHIEKSINRIKDFDLISSNTYVDTGLVEHLDSIVIIVCGLINLQKKRGFYSKQPKNSV